MELPVVSVSFRRQVPKVVGSIVLFMIVYLLLVAAATMLALFCFWLGFRAIASMHSFYAILAGLGLMAVGISVFVFLIKFIFAVARDENSHRIVITEEEQPRLFAFIRELTQQTGTRFPKKIFLSPDVNAAVFYHSSFWSMFLPTRKNLEIGLGLVNSVNVSEFKAVMAHEFGHFSQRSMKLGSFTYNVHKVVHNMLYENTGYTNFLCSWGSIHGLLGLFAVITARIAEGIQWILRGMYLIIHRTYLGLSREMEFHADAVAATVAGGNNVISSLSRTDVAGNCYQTALTEAGNRARENRVSRNIFANQLTVLRSFAAEHQLPVEQGLPAVTYSFVQRFSRSRINFKNQWASHPTLAERKRSLDELGIEMAADVTPAWSLFDNAEELQQRMTANLYRPVEFKGETRFYEGPDFEQEFAGQKERFALPDAYKGFYSGRFIDVGSWDLEALASGPAPVESFEELFNEDVSGLKQAIEINQGDIETLAAIQEKKIDVKSFDFDGVKYHRADAGRVAEQLRKEVAAQQERQWELEKRAFQWFVHRAGGERDRVIRAYRQYADADYDGIVKSLNAALAKIQPFYSGSISLEEVKRIIDELKNGEELTLKELYRRLLEDETFGSAELRDRMQRFVEANYVYFMTVAKTFNDHELNELRELGIAVATEAGARRFGLYKKMLVEQLDFAPPARRV